MAVSTQFGKRLIPQILDELSSTEPNRIVYSIAISSDISKGLRQVTAREFAQAVDRTAWWLHDTIGKSASFQTVGYIGPHDIRHILLTYACIKTGYKALFLSPKNSVEGALAVLEASQCDIWIKPCEKQNLPHVESFLRQRPMKVLEFPVVDDLLNAELARQYSYNKTFDEASQDPFCVLHTSGSTGLPKPITWTHALIGTMDAVRLLPPANGDNGMLPWTSVWNAGDRLYSSFPMSHGAGIIMNILMPSLFGLHCIMGPVGVIPNMDLVDSLVDHGGIDIWSMVPSLVDELGETPDVLAKFKSTKFICASGGPISPTSASKVNDVVRVLNLTGTTEGLFIGNLVVDREDWLYFAFHPFSGFAFKEVEPGLYEHWVYRNEHAPLFQGIFETFPDIQEINLKDLYVKHPTKPDHWAYKGRSDDIVVLSNGYKISPLDTEAIITAHPAISGCLVVGTAKPQAALLIELKDSSAGSGELFENIWQTVQQANSTSLHKDQLQKDYIMFAEVNKPFVRTDKGTVKRRATLALYGDYIDRFYSSRVGDADTELSVNVDKTSVSSIIKAVQHILGSLSPAYANVSQEADLFNLGLDSLLVFRTIRSLRNALGLKEELAPRHLYANPTIAKFSAALAQLVAEPTLTNGTKVKSDNKLTKMKEMLGKYKSRQSLKLNGLDLLMPKLYVKMIFYIPLRKDADFKQAFAGLQKGLSRTIRLIPALDGKVVACADQYAAFKKGCLRIAFDSPSKFAQESALRDSSITPRQLIYKDLSHILPSFEQLEKDGFLSSAFKDDLILGAPWFTSLPADVMVAQANFVDGGCLLAAGFHHTCFDGTGVVTAVRAWAESCRYVEGDLSADCSWLDPESMNRSLPQMLWEQEGYARPPEEVDPGTWGYLGFAKPDGLTNGHCPSKTEKRFHAPILPPPLTSEDHHLKSSTFLISSENLEKLQKMVADDPEMRDHATSASDIVQAMFWRAMIRARYRVAKEVEGRNFGPKDSSVLELPIDCRPYFSEQLPSTYMGNLIVVNRPTMAVETLCAPQTSIGHVALLIREAASRIRPSLIHDAFTLLQTVPDYNKLRYAFMRLEGLDAMITNMMLFPTSDVSFGGKFFDNNGAAEAVRPLMDGFNSAFRMCVILPTRKHGGVELLLGTFPKELEMLLEDKEFTSYAAYLG